MFSKNSLKAVLLVFVIAAMSGCDFKALPRLGHVGNFVILAGDDVTVNFTGNPVPPLGVTSTSGRFNDGTFQISTTQSTLPGDLHFRGTNHTSFLPPTAPSAVGNPF